MQAGDEITVRPTELVAGGAALAKVDGFPIFVTNVYPGDVAVVRLLEVKKGFAHADLVRLVEPSPFRRTIPCPVANECGGCDWTALRLDKQLEAKRRILTESLRRVGKIDPATLPPITVHPSPLNYRLRSRLHRDGDKVGFYATRTNDVVQLPAECEVVGVETARTLSSGANGGADAELQIWEVDATLITEGEMTIDGFHVTTDVFFQVNRHLLGTMRRLVSEIAARSKSKQTAADLYSGVGFFSVPLAGVFESVTAIEGSDAAHACAARNVPENVSLVHAPVEWWVERMPRVDFVFLDPPRSGAKRNVIDAIASRAGSMVCFLACDPVTFARDASRLIASGWRLASLDLLDLFPNTHHVETLASFERAQ
ncbi:MAG: rRNA (uracil1939-C5)-methyltransferase [Thermoanaerobaculia bacterium]|jgi:23S rRNA (uracil1939-C5)-methyltransferase|nr:rRNA (uracil1939-C5)-methyltransferase [Thermoanaerobaculia bacterium]